ncbi:MAG TPA: EAL domain-containing protein [Myxococcota bacterium]|nr:EAL domain-containing protein [Myxococcota bacterium]
MSFERPGVGAEASACAALLVSADAARVNHVRALLTGADGVALEHAWSLRAARGMLEARAFGVLLFDLPMFTEACTTWPDPTSRADLFPPIVVLSEKDDSEEALEVLRQGAQDYLDIHGESPRRIARCIRHAIERHRLIAELREAEARAQFAATHDPLTQLPNRHRFEEQLHRLLPQALRKGETVALLFLDLDRFKSINDTLGHAAGDAVLLEVAARLGKFTRRSDVVARVGGDEFLLLLNDMRGDNALSAIAAKIQKLLSHPFQIAGREYWIGASIGIAVFPRDGEDPDMLMRHADLALYQAKAGGRGTSRFYSDSLNDSVRRRLHVEHALRRALDRGGLRIVYQPIFSSADLRIVGAEALLRWADPELGTIPPAEFIAVAEHCGLIVPLGDAVLRTACDQLAQWKHEGHRLFMSVNVSAHQIDEEALRQLVSRALWDTGLDPRDLELEITESALMRDEQIAERTFRALKQIGVGVSLDDFGTGYSSLSYLKRFPVDTVKIDRSFIRDLTIDPDDAAIVSAILAIARQLGLNVVAEGVETEEQRIFLTERLCPQLQGFLLSAPLPAEEFRALLCAGPAPRKRGPN